MNNFSIKKILILVTILALPGFLYYLLQEKGKNRYRTLSYFGPKIPANTYHSKMGNKIRDTIYHEVKMPLLLDQSGTEFDLSKHDDRIFIINLFYTNAGHPASIAASAIGKLQSTYNRNDRVKFISVTLDSSTDTKNVLNLYASKIGAPINQWKLLSGNKDSIFNFVKKDLLLDVTESNPIAYTNMIVLLDYKHRIRGFYEAANAESLARLDDEIKVLLTEELRNINDGR